LYLGIATDTGGFRHGPQEIVRKGFRTGIWIDAERMRVQDLELARDLTRLGSKVLLIGQGLEENADQCILRLPGVPPRWQFLIDVIPIQIAAERFAAVLGEDPDSFRLCSYIVEDEGGLSGPAERPASPTARLLDAGFAPQDVVVAGPNERKGNLVVRYHGKGNLKPILLICHLDVVEAKRAIIDWLAANGYGEGTVMAIMHPDNPVAKKSVTRYMEAMRSVSARVADSGHWGRVA
jgi:hypothetical protein